MDGVKWLDATLKQNVANNLLTGYHTYSIYLLTRMSKPKGGRGRKAPYETTHVRVPVPIKPMIEKAIQQFYEGGENSDSELLSLDESLELAQQILKQKKSARVSMEKLLTAIYRTDISL